MTRHTVSFSTRNGHTGKDHLLLEVAGYCREMAEGRTWATPAGARKGGNRIVLAVLRDLGAVYRGCSSGIVTKAV